MDERPQRIAFVPFEGRGGAAVAISSRYVTFSLFLPVGLVFLVWMICRDARERSWLGKASFQIPAALGTALLLLALAGLPSSLSACAATEMRRREGKAALLLLHALPDDPHLTSHVCAEIDLIRTQAPLLSAIGYLHPALIAGNDAARIEADPATIGGVRGALEQVGRVDAEQIGVGGWAVFPGKGAPADAVFLTYDDASHVPVIFTLAEIGRPREDVARAQGTGAALLSGWVAIFPRSRLPATLSTANVTAWALDTDTGKAYRLDGARSIAL